MRMWVPDLPSDGDKQRFDGERHTDPASDHTDLNPATLAPRLLSPLVINHALPG